MRNSPVGPLVTTAMSAVASVTSDLVVVARRVLETCRSTPNANTELTSNTIDAAAAMTQTFLFEGTRRADRCRRASSATKRLLTSTASPAPGGTAVGDRRECLGARDLGGHRLFGGGASLFGSGGAQA